MPSSKSSVDQRDVYYRLGKSSGYRARSAYKLLHLSEEFDLFADVRTAVDLCAAPGSWSQVLQQQLRPTTHPDGPKVVAVDLQPMAPLVNISIVQTDITLPSTIPLVLGRLGGRKADLVVCDGAPDITGSHDLDAYLHHQLLLAALTLSLTLMAPGATLIFKIFLSPLDPKGEMLRSQLRIFFPGPDQGAFGEFDDEREPELGGGGGTQPGAHSGVTLGDERDGHEAESSTMAQRRLGGWDTTGRRGGVWVRKPRSSRKGSGEAFIVCRNFDRTKVPLPAVFPQEALDTLAKQTTGTLTLDSLAHLTSDRGGMATREWARIKAYVGSGDLNAFADDLPFEGENAHPTRPRVITATALDTSSDRLLPVPTPLKSSPAYRPSVDHSPPPRRNFPLPPARLHVSPPNLLSNATRRAASLATQAARRQPGDSPSSSPSSASGHDRPWDRNPSPLPSPNIFFPGGDGIFASQQQDVFSAAPRSDGDGAVSPALSTGSRTDLFFAAQGANTLPSPPKRLAAGSGVGLGLPSSAKKGQGHERTASLPGLRNGATPEIRGRAMSGVESSTHLSVPESSQSPLRPRHPSLPLSNTSPTPSPARAQGLVSPRFSGTSLIAQPLSTFPTFPDVQSDPQNPTSTRSKDPQRTRESQQLEREHREAPTDESPLNGGEVLLPVPDGGDFPVSTVPAVSWRLGEKLGEGAFSAVWSAERVSETSVVDFHTAGPKDSTQSAINSQSPGTSTTDTHLSIDGRTTAAIKMIDRRLTTSNTRTRIAFVREVEVLRHLSHPGIVSFLGSFSTATHHCLVLERLGGGELFELLSIEENRRRMPVPGPKFAVGSADGAADASLTEVMDEAGEAGSRGTPGGEESVGRGNSTQRPEQGQGDDGQGFVRRVFGELCTAVGWLHDVGVVHRDIKLENILFTVNPFLLPPTSTGSLPLSSLPTPLVKLTDFGLSRFINPASPLLETRCGSESFAAPEIIMGRPYDGRQTDSWAMGVVLYALMTGELPFDRNWTPGPTTLPSTAGTGSTPSQRSGAPSGAEPERLTEREEGKFRMRNIAKGEYAWPPSFSREEYEGVKEVVGGLLVRDPGKRMGMWQVWDLGWMAGEGGVSRPEKRGDEGLDGGGKGEGGIREGRRVEAGFLVGVEEGYRRGA